MSTSKRRDSPSGAETPSTLANTIVDIYEQTFMAQNKKDSEAMIQDMCGWHNGRHDRRLLIVLGQLSLSSLYINR